MPSTGISVTDDCMKVIKSLKDIKPRYVIFSIKATQGSKQEIQIEKIGDHDSTHEEFLAQFPNSNEGVLEGIRHKTVFVAWSTDTSSVKSRFVYAASRKGLKQYLPGINIEIQAGTTDALSMDNIIQKCLSVTK